MIAGFPCSPHHLLNPLVRPFVVHEGGLSIYFYICHIYISLFVSEAMLSHHRFALQIHLLVN